MNLVEVLSALRPLNPCRPCAVPWQKVLHTCQPFPIIHPGKTAGVKRFRRTLTHPPYGGGHDCGRGAYHAARAGHDGI